MSNGEPRPFKKTLLTVFLSLMFFNPITAQKEIWSTFGEHTKSQFTYRPLDFSGFTNASPGKVSVDAFGDFNFSVPLFDVPGRKLSYPLNLIYTPGIKVTQEASWVGLGWNFSDSYVERRVISFMDQDIPDSAAHWSDNITPVYLGRHDNGASDQYFVKLPDGRSATLNQHDLGTSGTDYYMSFIVEDGKAWNVEYERENHRFIVIDENGTTYIFSDAMLGYYYDRGQMKIGCNNQGAPIRRYVQPPINEPFVKWHLTAILHHSYDDNDSSIGADPYDPIDNTPSNKPKGDWIRIINELNDTQDKDWRYYTMRQMANSDLDDCSENVGESGYALWTPSRLYELTYPKFIITPTHIAEIVTEDEPYNPIADILEDKYGVFDEFPRAAGEPPTSWEFYNKFNEVETQRSEKGRRITSVKLFKNDMPKRNDVPLNLTGLIKEAVFEYYSPGDNFWDGTGVSFYEERSLLKSISITTLDEPYTYTFEYENVLTSNDVQSVSINGSNENILKCFKSSYAPNKNCNHYTQAQIYNPNAQYDDFSSPLLNYYRGAFNAATNSSIGADGYLNRNATLQNAFDNYTTDYSSLEDDVAMWSLEKITFPNGSTQEFEYQSDRYVVDFYHRGKDILTETFGPTSSRINWGFGIRLKSQTLRGGYGGDKTYTYEYASLDRHTNPGSETWWDGITNGGVITEGVGRIYADAIEIRTPNNCGENLDPFQCRQEVIPPTDYLSNQTERRVIYGRIKENQPDGSSITTYYDVVDLDDNRFPIPSSDIDKFNEIMGNRGAVKKVEFHNGSGVLVYTSESTNTELLRTGITDQTTERKFTYWLSETENVSTNRYQGHADVVSTASKLYNEENGLVAEEVISDPTGDLSKSRVTEYKYQYEIDASFKTANRLSDIEKVSLIDVNGITETILSSTKYDYNPQDKLSTVTTGYFLGDEIYNIQNILHDEESLVYQFRDAKAVNYAVHYTTEARVPTAIFSNAQYQETFFEDFEDGDFVFGYDSEPQVGFSRGFWGTISGTWIVEKGRLKHTSGTGFIWNYFPSTIISGSHNIEYDVYPNTGGINSEFRFGMNASRTSYYKVLVRNTKSGLKDINLYRTSSLKGSASLSGFVDSYEDPIHVKVRVNGTKIDVLVNGKRAISYTDPSVYTERGIGFYVSSSNTNQLFDNIRVYPLDAKAVSQSLEDNFLKIKEISDGNGIKSYHKYDELGRLELTLDHREAVQGQGYYSISNSTDDVVSYTTSTPIRTNSLIGLWRFNNSIEGYYEDFDTKLDGTPLSFSGATADRSNVIYQLGRVGSAAFSSSDEFANEPVLFNYGDLDSFDSPSHFTFAGWFYRTAHESYMIGHPSQVTQEGIHNILIANSSKSVNDDNTLQLGTNGSNIELYLNTVTGGGGKETFNAGIQDNQWYHIALTYEGNQVTNTTKLYLDGVLVKTWDANQGYWYDNLLWTNSPLTIGGANPTDPDGLFTGYVDDFMLFNKVLSLSEIVSLMNGAIASSTVADKLGKVTNEISKGRAGSEDFSSLSINNEYDIKGRKIATTRPNSIEKVGTTYYQDPLNRVHQIKLPATGATVPTTTLTYNSNTSSEQFTSFDNYTTGTLHKVVTNDPNGKQTIEYTNTIGQTIASIVDMDGDGVKSTGDLVTEFGYDDRGNLVKVKDPRGFTTQYEYDIHSRLTRKKLPDQDNWVNYKYDKSGNVRFVETAEHKKSGTSLSQSLDGESDLTLSKTLTPTKSGVLSFSFSIVDLIEAGYDIDLQDASNGNIPFFEVSLTGDGSVSNSVTVSSGSYKFYGATQSSWEGWHTYGGTYSFKPYTFSYTKYDHLNRITEVGEYYGSTSFASADATNASFPTTDKRALIEYKYDEENGYSGARNLAGNLAQVWYYNPNAFSQTPSKTYYSYNEQGLVEWIVQELRRDNGLSITKTIEYEYDKAGNLLELRYNPGGSDSFYQRYTYDGLSRVIKAETSLTGNADEWLTSAEYTYKSDGQVEQLILGENAQTVDYTYDNRGWLTGINNSGSVGSGPQQDRFFQALDYFSTSVTASKRQYNGNIAQQSWGFDTRLINKPDQTYTYTYDNANRLTYADRSGSGYTASAFDVSYSYDANGNISTVNRKNETGSSYTTSHFGNFLPNQVFYFKQVKLHRRCC